jgi:glutamate synthase (NADPH/NADH) small chain
MRTSTSHEEGCSRQWSILTKRFSSSYGRLNIEKIHCCKVDWIKKNNKWKMIEVKDTDFTIDADLVILALGFVHVVHRGMIENLGVKLDPAGNVVTDDCQTSRPWVFAAGDTVSGPSLVVRAIKGGRDAAAAINKWLATESQ